MDTFFAVTAPGLEPLAAQELRQLKLLPAELEGQRQERPSSWSLPGETAGGISFEGDLEALYRANLHLRTASRVLVRLGGFVAVSFPEFVKKAGRLPWERYLTPGQPVNLHVTCHKSRLYHSGAVAERVLRAIEERLGKPSPQQKADESSSGTPSQLIVVRMLNDRATISLDSSGELLHRRGYRLATAKAPLRETLAAALLLASGWDTNAPLLDPFCGSGTIAIEAALLTQGQPPGARRRFAFMDWPGYEGRRWDALLAEIRLRAPSEMPPIQGSDRDAGAVKLAQANAVRAGVETLIEFTHRAVSAIEPPPGPGWVVTNPPYGQRVSAAKDLRNLYAQLGNVLRRQCPGWQIAILSSDIRLLGQTGLALDTSFSFVNGGIQVRLGRGVVPRGEFGTDESGG